MQDASKRGEGKGKVKFVVQGRSGRREILDVLGNGRVEPAGFLLTFLSYKVAYQEANCFIW